MKRLLLFLLCQGSLDGFSQNICPVHHIPNCKSLHLPGDATSVNPVITIYELVAVLPKPDTLAAHLLVSHRPPSFGHSIEGYCIVVNDICTGRHLVYRRRKFVEIKPPYDVWRCIRKEVGRD